MNPPVFIISLDFELHWGRFDKTPMEGNEQYYLQTRQAIPKILQLFEEFNMEATWATVGMLFAKDLQEWEQFSPVDKPSYSQQKFSAYHWLKRNHVGEEFLFAPDLIKTILNTKGQELGSHTFSHYYTLADGQTPNQFRQDLQAVQQVAKEKLGVVLSSLVFPRNQFNQIYMKICREEGFTTIRSNPSDWYWKDTSQESLIKKIFRTGDTMVPLGKTSSYPLSEIQVGDDFPLMLPASRFFRPYHSRLTLLNRLKMKRILHEMTYAAQKGEVYHLWWHPHNFGRNPQKSLEELKEILKHYGKLRSQYGMLSRNMNNTSKMIHSVKEEA